MADMAPGNRPQRPIWLAQKAFRPRLTACVPLDINCNHLGRKTRRGMPKPPHSRGFSLILSLTIMAGIVMLVITLSSFITIESRAAMHQQLAARARLNGILAMRLARWRTCSKRRDRTGGPPPGRKSPSRRRQSPPCVIRCGPESGEPTDLTNRRPGW